MAYKESSELIEDVDRASDTDDDSATASTESEYNPNYPDMQKIINSIKAEEIELDALQQFFVDLTSDITPDSLRELVNEYGLFIKKYSSDKYNVYQITLEEIRYSAGTYIGKKTGEVLQDNVTVSFDMDDGAAEYYLYLQFNGPYSSYGELIYYNHGRYGDSSNVLWNEYMTEDVSGFYLNSHTIQTEENDNYLQTEFRDDEDVPYYYRGRTELTGLQKLDCGSELMQQYLITEAAIEEYNRQLETVEQDKE